MRTYTLLFSIATHVLAVCAIVIATVTANDALPDVRRAVDFIVVTAPQIQPPPAPVQPQRAAVRPPVAAAPLTAPDGIQPEVPIELPSLDTTMDSVVVPDFAGPPPVGGEAPPPPPPVRVPIHVGGNIQPPTRIESPPPTYPAMAKAAGVEGTVILEATIGEDGVVRGVRTLRSIPLLDAAAIEAVQRWRFTPTLLNGTPVPVVMTVTVTFNLR